MKISFLTFVALLLSACQLPTKTVINNTVVPTENNQATTITAANDEPVAATAALVAYCENHVCRQNVGFKLRTKTGLFEKQAALYWPIIQGEKISVLAGEHVHVKGAVSNEKLMALELSHPQHPQALSFKLQQDEQDTGMLLVVQNPLDQALKLSIDWVDFEGNLHPSASCSVPAGGGIFEMWPHAFKELVVSNIRTVSEDNKSQCVY